MKGEKIEQSPEFERAIGSNDRNELSILCDAREKSAHGNEAEIWKFLKFLFSPDLKKDLLTHLGFEDFISKVDVEETPLQHGNNEYSSNI